MVEVTIEITQFCEERCDYCSTNANPEGKHLTLEEIKDFLNSITEPVHRINISGDEPLANPYFYRIKKYCDSICDEVWVYSNMIENLIYNSDIIREVSVHANVCVIEGREIYIPKNADKVHILKLINQGRAKDFSEQNIVVSRNFYDPKACATCNHILFQANGQVVRAPCVKEYDS